MLPKNWSSFPENMLTLANSTFMCAVYFLAHVCTFLFAVCSRKRTEFEQLTSPIPSKLFHLMETLMLLFIARYRLQVAALVATEFATVMGHLSSATV